MAKRKIGPKRKATIAVDLNKVSHELRGIVLETGMEILGELAERIAQEANNNAPTLQNEKQTTEWTRKHRNSSPAYKNGPIKGSIFSMLSPNVPASYLVVSPAWYSHFVEYGTDEPEKPIRARGKKPMAFYNQDGKLVFKRQVKEHKMKKKPFLRPAADKADEFLLDIINKKYGV